MLTEAQTKSGVWKMFNTLGTEIANTQGFLNIITH